MLPGNRARACFLGKQVVEAITGLFAMPELKMKALPNKGGSGHAKQIPYSSYHSPGYPILFSVFRASGPGLGGGIPHKTRKSDRADGRWRRSGCNFQDAFQRG
jgi:hypothetical protein